MFEFCACSSDNCCVIAEGESGANAGGGGAVVGIPVAGRLEMVMEVVEVMVVVVEEVERCEGAGAAVGMAVVMVRVESEAGSSLPGMRAEEEGNRAGPDRQTEEIYIARKQSNS